MNSETIAQTIEAFQEPASVAFVQMCLKTSYARHCPGHDESVQIMVAEMFSRLQNAGLGSNTLLNEANDLSRKLFRIEDPTFWFTRAYRHYKSSIRVDHDYAELCRMLRGERILDFGCGSGLTAKRLAAGGYAMTMADTLDYRSPEARTLPFTLLSSSTRLPFADGAFDTALAYCVIHHIDGEEISATLTELARVAHHVLLVEDVYGIEQSVSDLKDSRVEWLYNETSDEDILARYASLTQHQQYLALVRYRTHSEVVKRWSLK